MLFIKTTTMKNLLLVSALAFLSTGVIAQKGLHQGIKGAPQSTWMLNDFDHKSSGWEYVPTFGYSFGISFAHFFSDAVGLGLDLTYSSQGQKYTIQGQQNFTELSYLKIPVLFHYHSSADKTALFYLNVGPQISYLLTARGLRSSQYIYYSSPDMTDIFNQFNIGAVLALGAGFNLTDFLMLTTGIRVDADFTNEQEPFVPSFYSLSTRQRPTHNANAGFEIGLRYVMRSK